MLYSLSELCINLSDDRQLLWEWLDGDADNLISKKLKLMLSRNKSASKIKLN